MSAVIRPNTILDIDNASSSYVNSEIDSYDWTKLYDSTYGSNIAFPTEPHSLNFECNDISNWYDWRNAYLAIQFQIKKKNEQNSDVVTCRTDPIRQIMKKATFSINDTVITDNHHVDKYAVMDRACYSKQFYDTSAKEWLCYDEDVDTADFPPSDHTNSSHSRYPQGNAKWKTETQAHDIPPALDPTNQYYNAYDTIDKTAAYSAGYNAVPPYWGYDLHTGIGKLFRLTNGYQENAPPTGNIEDLEMSAFGNVVQARIPLMCIFRFFAYLKCVLKNTKFSFHFELKGTSQEDKKSKLWTMKPNTIVDEDYGPDEGFLLRNAWIEVARVVPSPARIVSLNNSLLNSPKIAISYPNYNVYKNPIAIGTTETEFLIQNVTERLIRVTCFLQRETVDSTDYFQPWNCVCPRIEEFGLKLNGVSIPYSNMKNSWNSERYPYLATIAPIAINNPTDLRRGLDTSDAYRAYQEQCNNYYLYQPYDTKDGILPRFQGNGRLNPVQFASGSFYFTVDVARSRQSQEFLGGSGSLTASFRFGLDTKEIYNCWSIVENSSLVDISLQERSAFIVVK